MKGVDYLIKAFNKLNRKDTRLIIVGSGNQEADLKYLAKNNKNISFAGYKEGKEKADYFSISDFFVFPTLHDCWGLVVNEALYYGLPVISTNKAGAMEIIDEAKTGFIIPDKDIGTLTNVMRRLLDNPSLLAKMKENVKKIPKEKIVDIRTSVKTFEKAINSSLKT
jgi:glycosyltransferase involved in cell wall biosynthesis